MPLICESTVTEPEKFVGVTFAMIDEKTKERIICRVTYEALTDRAQADGLTDAEWLKAWEQHQKSIAVLASTNYDNGKPRIDDQVIVDTDELTPLSKTPGRFVA